MLRVPGKKYTSCLLTKWLPSTFSHSSAFGILSMRLCTSSSEALWDITVSPNLTQAMARPLSASPKWMSSSSFQPSMVGTVSAISFFSLRFSVVNPSLWSLISLMPRKAAAYRSLLTSRPSSL